MSDRIEAVRKARMNIAKHMPEADAAMIDRVVHHADVLTLKGASYRLRNRGIDTLPSIRWQQDRVVVVGSLAQP